MKLSYKIANSLPNVGFIMFITHYSNYLAQTIGYCNGITVLLIATMNPLIITVATIIDQYT